MREALEHWDFVIAAYAIGVGGLVLLTAWSWRTMARAEARREELRKK